MHNTVLTFANDLIKLLPSDLDKEFQDNASGHENGLVNLLWNLARNKHRTTGDSCYAATYNTKDRESHGSVAPESIVVDPTDLGQLQARATAAYNPTQNAMHYAFNFVYGLRILDGGKIGKPTWRFGIGQPQFCAPGGNCEHGIKHYQLCELQPKMLLIFSGVLHVLTKNGQAQLVVSPMSGRWATITSDALDYVRLRTLNEFDSRELHIIKALDEQYGSNTAEMYLDMYMTSAVQKKLVQMWRLDTANVDSCLHHMINEHLIRILKEVINNDPCGMDIYNAL